MKLPSLYSVLLTTLIMKLYCAVCRTKVDYGCQLYNKQRFFRIIPTARQHIQRTYKNIQGPLKHEVLLKLSWDEMGLIFLYKLNSKSMHTDYLVISDERDEHYYK